MSVEMPAAGPAENPGLTVIIPCYNEESIIEASCRRIKAVCEALDVPYEIVLGNDGSSDNTLDVLKSMSETDSKIRITSHYPNRGAGFTYREMYGVARGETIIQMDADLAMPAEEVIPRLLAALKHADIAVGSRYAGVKADYPLKRRVFSRGYIWLTHLLFRLDVVDTQTGFIGFHRRILEGIDLRSDGFELLLEFIAQANMCGYRVVEVGLPWYHDTTSGETEVWSESIKMLTGTMRVRRRISRMKSKQRRGGRPAPEPPAPGDT